MIRLLPVLLIAALVLGACGAPEGDAEGPGRVIETGEGTFTLISVAELDAMLADKDFTFVNVHIPYQGEIEPTDLFIPFDEITVHLDQFPDKDARIVLYCRSGRMSDSAARDLVAEGYTDVYDVAGGMVAWQAAGLPLVDMPQ